MSSRGHQVTESDSNPLDDRVSVSAGEKSSVRLPSPPMSGHSYAGSTLKGAVLDRVHEQIKVLIILP